MKQQNKMSDFFLPIQHVLREFEFGRQGRRTGEVNIDFATHQEAVEATKKHRTNMQHCYIELFLKLNKIVAAVMAVVDGFGEGNGLSVVLGDQVFGREGGGFGYGLGLSNSGGFGNQVRL